MPEFQTFKKRMVPLTKAPYVTIQRRGTMSFNRAAYAALGEPAAVELLYDPDEKIMGFRGIEPEVEHAYSIRPVGGSNDNTYMVSGRAFTQFFNIDTAIARRYRVYAEDGVLCLDMKEPGTEVTGPRAKKDENGSSNGHGSPPLL